MIENKSDDEKMTAELEKLKRKALLTTLFSEEANNQVLFELSEISYFTIVYLSNLTNQKEAPNKFILQVLYKSDNPRNNKHAQEWYKVYAKLFTRLFGFGLYDKYNSVIQVPKKYIQNKTYEFIRMRIEHTMEQTEKDGKVYEPVIVFGSQYSVSLYTESRIQAIKKQIDWKLHQRKLSDTAFRMSLTAWRKLIYLEGNDKHWSIDGYFITEKHKPTLWKLRPFIVPEQRHYISRKTLINTYNTNELTTGGFVIDRTRYIVPLFHIFIA